MADVMFGKTAPSGRLPFTVPTGEDFLPPYLNMHMGHPPGRTYRYLTDRAASQPYITALTFFQNGAKHRDLRCSLQYVSNPEQTN